MKAVKAIVKILVVLVVLTLLGGAGYMEYYVQRHGDKAVFSYSVMTACLGAIVALALVAFFRAKQAEQ